MTVICDDLCYIKAILHLPRCCMSCIGCSALHRSCVQKLKTNPKILMAEYNKQEHNVYCTNIFPMRISNHQAPHQLLPKVKASMYLSRC